MNHPVLVGTLAGATLGLDHWACGQFMLSRPIVTGPLVGWAAGDAQAGFVAGVLLELLWLRVVPVGVTVPPDVSTMVAVSAGTFAVVGMGRWSALLPALIWGMACGVAARVLDVRQRKLQGGLSRWVQRGLDRGAARPLEAGIAASLAITWTRRAAVIAVGLALGRRGLPWMLGRLSPGQTRWLVTAGWCVPAIGFVIAAMGLWPRRSEGVR